MFGRYTVLRYGYTHNIILAMPARTANIRARRNTMINFRKGPAGSTDKAEQGFLF